MTIALPLAQVAAAGAANWNMLTALGVAMGVAINLFIFVRMAGGKDGERQIEPTALHAITSELKTQTATLNKLDREMGEVSTKVDSVEKSVDGFHQRIGGVSLELAATAARVDGLEKREIA
jgi:hypothetical protein